MALILVSVALFLAVTAFSRHQGLFRAESMGIGQLLAVLLYAIFWLAPSLAMLVGHWIG